LLIDDLEWRSNLNGARSGLSTGFVELDNMLDGLQLGEMVVIGARPSIGKTAIGINIIHRVAVVEKIPSLFISLEMSSKALMRRVLSSSHDISMSSIRRGRFTEGEFKSVAKHNNTHLERQMFIIEAISGLDINRLCASARGLVRRHGIKLIVVDYLQKVKPSRSLEKRTYEVAEVSGALKALAVATNTAVVALAQLNRESEKSKSGIPHMSDLGDSGQIERDADVVALLHRDKNDPTGKTTLIVAKQRDGETGMVDLKFNGPFARFENPEYNT
jgi:replicative DNA helicase